MKITNEELIKRVVERRKLWGELYSPDYIRKFFSLYDGELEALIALAQAHVAGPHKFLGENI